MFTKGNRITTNNLNIFEILDVNEILNQYEIESKMKEDILDEIVIRIDKFIEK